MGLIIKEKEGKKINVQALDINLSQVYGRVRFLGTPDGRGIEFETLIWKDKSKFKEENAAQNMLSTDIPTQGQRAVLVDGMVQSSETALIVAKAYFENLGYDCDIED